MGRIRYGDETGQSTDPDGEIDEVIAAMMAASRLLIAVSARAVASVDEGLTLPQLRALVVLEGHGPVKLAVLAASLGVNPSNALRMVERLEVAGWVDRQVNPRNRREVQLSVTERGAQLVQRVMSRRRAEMGELVARLSKRDRAGLVAALRALTAAGENLAVDPFSEIRQTSDLAENSSDVGAPPSEPLNRISGRDVSGR